MLFFEHFTKKNHSLTASHAHTKKKSHVQFQTPIYSTNCKPTFGGFILLLISISPETRLIQSPSRW